MANWMELRVMPEEKNPNKPLLGEGQMNPDAKRGGPLNGASLIAHLQSNANAPVGADVAILEERESGTAMVI